VEDRRNTISGSAIAASVVMNCSDAHTMMCFGGVTATSFDELAKIASCRVAIVIENEYITHDEESPCVRESSFRKRERINVRRLAVNQTLQSAFLP
jgi:hypothetical protein